MSSFLSQIDTILTGLGDDATADEIANALQSYSKRDIQAVLAARASDEGGGGAALTVTGDTGSVADVTTLDIGGSTVTEISPGVAAAVVSVPVLSARVELTDAQIKALPSAEIELVAAPGAGAYIFVVSTFLRVDTAANGYDNFAATCQLLVTSAGETIGAAQGFLNADGVEDLFSAFDVMTVGLGPYTTASVEIDDPAPDTSGVYPSLISSSDLEDKALVLKVINGVQGNFIDGDAANSASVTVLYMIVDL